MKQGDVIILPMPQADGRIKNRPAISLREMPPFHIAIPGQALAYKIGQLKILELRRKSERELGAKFSIRDFHDEILKDGALPLDVLERKIKEWIARQKG